MIRFAPKVVAVTALAVGVDTRRDYTEATGGRRTFGNCG